MQLKVKRLHPDAILPKYATEGAACFDLHAIKAQVVIGGRSEIVETGLAFQVPDGCALLVYSRSGNGFKAGIRLANGTGVVDSDYRGPVKIKLHNDSDKTFLVSAGDRIAQAMLVPIPRVELVEVDELTDTARGEGGFGSTGP